MAALGILFWVVVLILILVNREKRRQQKISAQNERQKVLREFRLEIFDYAKSTGKIGKRYIVDAEGEGGDWVYIYNKWDEEKVSAIISKHEKYILVPGASPSINLPLRKLIIAEIDVLPVRKDTYIK